MKLRSLIPILALALVLVFVVLLPHVALAQEVAQESSGGWGSWLLNIAVDGILGFFARLVAVLLWLFSFFLYFAAWIFDTAIIFSITNGAFRAENVAIIGVGWPVVRDVASLFIVLAMLVISIATMLQLEAYSYKKALPRLILVALLVSFSLPVGQFVIDASNVFAVGLYNNITDKVRADTNMESATSVFKVKLNTTKDISSVFARGLSVASFQAAPSNSAGEAGTKILNGTMALIVSGIMGIIVTLVAAFVLGALGMLFIARTIALWLLLVFSPAAFAAMIFPATAGYARQWWELLLKQSFFAPISLFMIWLVAKFLENDFVAKGLSHTTSAAGFTSGFTSSMQLVMQYIVLIFLLWKTLTIAQSFGAKGAATMVSTGERWAGVVKDAAKNSAKRTGNSFAGRAVDRAIGSQGSLGRVSRAVVGNRVSSALGITRGVLNQSAKGKEAREYTATKEAETLKNLAPRERARALSAMSGNGALEAFDKMSNEDRSKVAKEMSKANTLDRFSNTIRAAAARDPRSKGLDGKIDDKFRNDTLENLARAALPHAARAEDALRIMNPELFATEIPTLDSTSPSYDAANVHATNSAIAKLMNGMKADDRADVFIKNGIRKDDAGSYMRRYFADNGSSNDINKNEESMEVSHEMMNQIVDQHLTPLDRGKLEREAEAGAHAKAQKSRKTNADEWEIDAAKRKAYAGALKENGEHNLANVINSSMGSVLFDPAGTRVRNPS